MGQERSQWGSKLGFILAASGSAIGLGNIVFFPANAYKYGAGAFYLPYFIALFVVGMPVMTLELGMGRFTGRAFPATLRQIAGKKGEVAGWFGVLNASMITMYYLTILGWVVGMLRGSLGGLWSPGAVEAFGLPSGALSSAMSYFFNMISRYDTVVFVAVVWLLNMLIVFWGTKSIEAAVKVFVPLMWIFMLVLIVRGLSLDNGGQGVYLLFTPDFSVMKDVEVWRGAFSQIFFTLSLGFGIMTTYSSYLPPESDDISNAGTISFMNSSFEFIAGLAIFSLLFTFAITPKASTLSMMFFVVPEGIAKFPFAVALFGVLFFTLLLFAGLTSSVSLVEAVVSSLLDKFPGASRGRVTLVVTLIGFCGSALFALPTVIDKGLDSNGTLGLSLLDLYDHWVFGYGLMLCGLLECVLTGWFFDLDKLLEHINRTGSLKLGGGFKALIKFVIPAIILIILGSNAVKEITGGLYGHDMSLGGLDFLSPFALVSWLGLTIIGALVLSGRRAADEEAGR